MVTSLYTMMSSENHALLLVCISILMMLVLVEALTEHVKGQKVLGDGIWFIVGLAFVLLGVMVMF